LPCFAGGPGSLDRLRQDLRLSSEVDTVEDTSVANEEPRAGRLVLGPGFKSCGVEPPRGLVGAEGIGAIAGFMKQLGLGRPTGIDLHGEAAGVLPSPEWKMKRFRRPEQQRWYPGETISIGIGQGYNAYTPIQLAQGMATVAANGAMYRPRVVAHVENARTRERQSFEPELVQQVPLHKEYVEFVKRAMAGVNKEGTGARAFARAEYTSGGKTGTAQVIAMKQNEKYDEKKIDERHRDHSLYIAFAPLENPIIAMLVIVENGGFGARAAAPIARTVLDYYLLGKLPAALQAAEQEVDDDRESD